MKKAIITLKTDAELKRQAQAVTENLGISLSAYLNAMLRKVVRERSVTLSEEPEFNEETKKLLREALADIKAGRDLSPVFNSAQDMIAHMRAKMGDM